ncbi:hypothetical protein [Streptomyces sp. NPDC051567]|uniref:hypothetical protein n=1 Tax=Streptomyces sp. NPDC051567 TaxID=3365660 RepID=UPI0037AFE186
MEGFTGRRPLDRPVAPAAFAGSALSMPNDPPRGRRLRPFTTGNREGMARSLHDPSYTAGSR